MSTASIRKYRQHDFHALLRLINLADRADDAGYNTTEERLTHELADPRMQGLDSVFVAEAGGELVGYVWLVALQPLRLDRLIVRGIVAPAWRRRGIGTLLMRRAARRAQELTSARPVILYMSVRAPVSGATELALSLGFQPVRYFYYMECGDLTGLPEPAFPEGIHVREYAPGQDEEAFVAAYCEAFADHWGFVPHTLQQEQHRVGAPHFRTEDNLLAVGKDGQIAGLCLLEFSEAEPGSQLPSFPMIDDLAVRPAYRRRGIGRALMISGMRSIAERGYPAIGLAVDVDNTNNALRLYQSLGFIVKWHGTVYQKELQ